MAIDEDNDDGLGGRTSRRREVVAANQWADRLIALTPPQLDVAPLPDVVRAAVREYAVMPNPSARKRQRQLIDKRMRAVDDETRDAVLAWLDDPDADPLAAWVDRLITGGDEAIDAWLADHPDADRQRLRTLARNAAANPKRRRALRDALT